MIEQELTKSLIGAAIEVHKHWGPGLYEEMLSMRIGFTPNLHSCVISLVKNT